MSYDVTSLKDREKLLFLIAGEWVSRALYVATKLQISENTGIPASQLAFKAPFYEYFKDHPISGTIFQEAMKARSQAISKAAISSYDFGQFATICDVGGGHGHFVVTLLDNYSNLKGLLFELPEVIKEVQQDNYPYEKRLQLCAGDFFVSLPANADAFFEIHTA
jgi:hypothetical protein